MKYIKLVFPFLVTLACIGCAGPKYAPDPSLTRSKANSAYNDLDQETGSSPALVQSSMHQEPAVTAAEGAVENLPTIMVLPAHSGKGSSELQVVSNNPMSKAMMESINSYLTQKRYNVKSLEGESQLEDVVKMQNDIANTDDDLSYLASLALGADVYVKFSGSVTTENATVEVNAYETSTGRLLGSQTAEVKNNGHTDQANLRANVQSAARKAMPNLEQKILAYWKLDLQKGIQYKVVMNLKGEFTDSQIEDIHDAAVQSLRKNFNSVTVNVMTDRTIDLVVYADPGRYTDAQDVYSQIRQLLKGQAETKKINITKKMILMDLR